MSIQWQYGDKCSVCKGEFGSFRCKGMCNSCYCKERKRTNPKLFKENRRGPKIVSKNEAENAS